MYKNEWWMMILMLDCILEKLDFLFCSVAMWCIICHHIYKKIMCKTKQKKREWSAQTYDIRTDFTSSFSYIFCCCCCNHFHYYQSKIWWWVFYIEHAPQKISLKFFFFLNFGHFIFSLFFFLYRNIDFSNYQ